MKQVYSWLTSSRTPEAMILAWGVKARDRRRHAGPIVFRPLLVQGAFCALTSRAVFVFRGKTKSPFGAVPPATRPPALLVGGRLLRTPLHAPPALAAPPARCGSPAGAACSKAQRGPARPGQAALDR
jgi:hypothetical protein